MPLRAGPYLLCVRVRYTLADDCAGVPVWLDTDEYGGPVPHSEERIDLVPDTYDREDGLTLVDLAVQVLRKEGCTEDMGHWFADPDGGHTVDYGAGIEEESSVHPYNVSPEDYAAIAARLKG